MESRSSHLTFEEIRWVACCRHHVGIFIHRCFTHLDLWQLQRPDRKFQFPKLIRLWQHFLCKKAWFFSPIEGVGLHMPPPPHPALTLFAYVLRGMGINLLLPWRCWHWAQHQWIALLPQLAAQDLVSEPWGQERWCDTLQLKLCHLPGCFIVCLNISCARNMLTHTCSHLFLHGSGRNVTTAGEAVGGGGGLCRSSTPP